MSFNVFSKIVYAIFILGIFLIGTLLVVSTLPVSGNYELKIVLSGSMEPSITTGSLVIVKPSERYEVGDVITFGEDSRKRVPTTHRIIEVRVVSGEYLFVTKGDANENADGNEVLVDDIVGKVLFSVPYAGYILDLAKKPLGFAFLIGIPASVIVLDEVWKIVKEVRRMRREKSGKEVVESKNKSDEETKNGKS